MKRMAKAMVVDDHPLMAQATKQLLDRIENVEVTDVAHTGKEAIAIADKIKPDLVFLDYQLPDLTGIQVAEVLKANSPFMRIVIFTGIDVPDLLPLLLEHKISGVISKGVNESTIKHVVACVLDNHIVLPHSIFHQIKLPSRMYADEVELTEEECTLMVMVVRGETYERIAEQLFISKRSVDNYLRKIYEKFGVQSRIQAIERFVQSRQYADML